MEKRRTVWLWTTVAGGIIGGFLASWLAPKVIAWYFDPPASYGISCRAPIEWALKRLQMAQFIGTLVGGVAGLIVYFAFRKKHPEEITGDLSP